MLLLNTSTPITIPKSYHNTVFTPILDFKTFPYECRDPCSLLFIPLPIPTPNTPWSQIILVHVVPRTYTVTPQQWLTTCTIYYNALRNSHLPSLFIPCWARSPSYGQLNSDIFHKACSAEHTLISSALAIHLPSMPAFPFSPTYYPYQEYLFPHHLRAIFQIMVSYYVYLPWRPFSQCLLTFLLGFAAMDH
jgi:hypothetical protein